MNSITASERSGARHEIKRGALRELGLPTLFGAAVLFFSATMLLGANISAMRGNLIWIERTQQVLQEISIAESAVVGDELTVRSYALTGDPRFLVYETRGRNKLAASIARLEKLAAAEPGGTKRMRTIAESVRRHTELYTSVTGMGPDKAAIVGRFINDDAKRAVTFAARRALADYRADELRILGERQQNLTRQLSQAFLLAIGIIVAAFVLGGLGLLMTRWGMQTKR